MSGLKPFCCIVVALAISLSTFSGVVAQSESTFPNYSTPDAADARDPGMPDPQYADGSPGQYVLIGSQWPQSGGKGTPITLTYSFQNMFDGALKMPNGQPLPASLIRGSIEETLRLWSSVAPINFVEVPDDGLWYGSSTHYGQIRYRHVYINGPDPAIGDPVAKAQTYYPAGDGYPGDVEFDDSDAWQEVGTLRQPDILGAALHETGHALGLGHATGIIPGQYWSYPTYNGTGQVVDHLEPKGNADMFWIFNRYSGLGTGQLMPDDIAGIQAIYGAGSGSVTPLGVPEPSAVKMLAVCAAGLGVSARRRHRKSLTNNPATTEVLTSSDYDAWRDRFIQCQSNGHMSSTRHSELVRLLGEIDQLIEREKSLLLQPIDDVVLARIFKQLDDMQRSRRALEVELMMAVELQLPSRPW